MIDLLLPVVRLPKRLGRAVLVTDRHGWAGPDRVHEDLHDPAAQTVGDVVLHERAAGCVLGRGEEAWSAAHLVNHDRQLAAFVSQPIDLSAFGHDQRVAHAGDAM